MDTSTNRYNYARDGFIYLLSYATLIIFSVGLNFLLKAITNKYLPDAADTFQNLFSDSSIIVFLAAVVIAFPIFLYLNFVANKMLGNGKMRHHTGVRNWLLYLTLVVVILIIIWQIISIFISYLNGTLALIFIIHTLITLIIAFAILGYQYWHLRFFDGQIKPIPVSFKVFEWSIILIIIASVITGLLIIDSPTLRRIKRLDQTRIERLSDIRMAVYNFYDPQNLKGYHRLPKDLNELVNDVRIYIARDGLLDPDTTKEEREFEYKIIGAKSYQLCATFDTEFNKDTAGITSPELLYNRSGTTFYHPIGYYCFDLSILDTPAPEKAFD